MLDTSAAARRNKPSVEPMLTPLIEEGLVARCTFTDLEAGLLGRNTAHHRTLSGLRATWPLVEVDQGMLDRAWDVQQLLVQRNHHRAVKTLDLLIAAAAELADLVVLHYDRDYDRIAKVTGQRTEWIVAAGTAD
ncbi:MAG TPA: PIN domain-containing protein [Acidimicrobiales bacterium]|jgi:predicted nucleic acid-binding protein|nr:PIN domain-containing protein [Acidimicrobiales bacterium]